MNTNGLFIEQVLKGAASLTFCSFVLILVKWCRHALSTPGFCDFYCTNKTSNL